MCQHCQSFKPIYVEAAKQLQNDPDGIYLLGDVNTLFHEKLGKHFQIRGLPTVMAFSPVNDYNPTTFNKNRTVFDLITYIELASGLISKELPKYEDLSYRLERRDEDILLGIFKNKNHPLFKEMNDQKEEFNFVRMYYTFNIDEFKAKLQIP
jgi:hypothetical protein